MLIEKQKRKARLRVVLAVAAALGSSSACFSGGLGALMIQQPIQEVVA